MGIPTVKRKVRSYLTETLHSLIDKLSPEEKLDCVMVVFIGEVIDLHFQAVLNLSYKYCVCLFTPPTYHSSYPFDKCLYCTVHGTMILFSDCEKAHCTYLQD